MNYYEFRTDSPIVFNSMHTIDNLGWKPKVKLLSDFDLIFVLNNPIRLQCDTQNYTVNPNEVFFAYPGQSVYIYPDTEPKSGVTVLHFSAASYSKKHINDLLGILNGNVTSPKNRIYLSTLLRIKYDHAFTILNTMFTELKYRRFGYIEKLNLCLQELLFELHRSCAEEIIYGNVEYNYSISNKYTRKIINFLHNNYMNDITGEDIKQHLSVSYDYANLVFKNVTGFTIMNYLNNIRIARAKDLLESTSLTIYEIANLVGIKDAHYFSKKFKALEGVSPSMFKRD